MRSGRAQLHPRVGGLARVSSGQGEGRLTLDPTERLSAVQKPIFLGELDLRESSSARFRLLRYRERRATKALGEPERTAVMLEALRQSNTASVVSAVGNTSAMTAKTWNPRDLPLRAFVDITALSRTDPTRPRLLRAHSQRPTGSSQTPCCSPEALHGPDGRSVPASTCCHAVFAPLTTVRCTAQTDQGGPRRAWQSRPRAPLGEKIAVVATAPQVWMRSVDDARVELQNKVRLGQLKIAWSPTKASSTNRSRPVISLGVK